MLNNQSAINFADFGESTLMLLDWHLEGDDEDGYSILTDIGQFGTVTFEIVTVRA